MSLYSWCHQGPRNPSSCATITFNCHWRRADTGGKSLVFMHAASLWSCSTPCNHVDCGLPGFSVREGFSSQEYRSVLANTGCHALLERCISCCHSHHVPSFWCCQNPCNPSSCTTSTPGLHRGKPKFSRAASGANPRG